MRGQSDLSKWGSRTAVSLLEALSARHYRSWDPYDVLLCKPLARLQSPKTMVIRRVGVQVVRRSPIPLQPLLGIPPTVSAYTLGESLTALARLSFRECTTSSREEAIRIGADLAGMAAKGWTGLSWGSAMDVATRFGYFPRSTPNIVVTAFVARGMVEATRFSVLDCRAELAEVCRFILEVLPRSEDGAGIHFGYAPNVRVVVHNSNMLAAMVLAGAGGILGDERCLASAASAARFTAAHQREDGSWPYSESSRADWVDGFHTSFILQGLHAVSRTCSDERLMDSFLRGLRFYQRHLIGGAGQARFSSSATYPLDAMAASQALEVLGIAHARDQTTESELRGVVRLIQTRMLAPNGRVAYQVHRLWTDWRWFARWSVAPMAAAAAGLRPVGVQEAASAETRKGVTL